MISGTWDTSILGGMPLSLVEALAEVERWRRSATLGSKESAWLSEECWREAVKNTLGADAYLTVQVEAARLRGIFIPPGKIR